MKNTRFSLMKSDWPILKNEIR